MPIGVALLLAEHLSQLLVAQFDAMHLLGMLAESVSGMMMICRPIRLS